MRVVKVMTFSDACDVKAVLSKTNKQTDDIVSMEWLRFLSRQEL